MKHTRIVKHWFYGIYGIRLLWHGEWSDPELVWHGKLYGYYDLEDTLCSIYSEEPQTLDFDSWVKANAQTVRELLAEMTPIQEVSK